MSKKIFINYRLDDTASYARGIGEGLSRVFGADQVFMDIKSLPAGHRFEQELDRALRECAVFIVVIGPGWLEYIKERSSSGERDYVSAEIAAALKRDIPIIPVCVGRRSSMPPFPKASDLPGNIRDLVSFQKVDVSHESYDRDMENLASAIRSLDLIVPSSTRRFRWQLGMVAASAVVAAGAVVFAMPVLFGLGTCNVAGQWMLKQDNGPRVFVDLKQDENGILAGSAHSGGAPGTVSGRVSGTNVKFRVTWTNNNQVGDYAGVVTGLLSYRLTGESVNANDPSIRADWRSKEEHSEEEDKTFKCKLL